MIPQMTRGQRTRAVLLLRCAAEAAVTGDYVLGPGFETAPRLGIGRRECDLAERAAMRVAKKAGRQIDGAGSCDEYVATVLEAAIILEEDSWP
ncbi:MAG TPA: hypothetical protein VLE97_09020 [Gaiellaceae bacterium]|nr:hypothetical protein [Gaiellaceae bacterium]